MALTSVEKWKYINTGSTPQNVRTGPGTSNKVIDTISMSLLNTTFNVRDIQTASNGIDWVEVEYQSGDWGWCAIESQDSNGKWYYYWEYVSSGGYAGEAFAKYYWPDAGTTTYKLQKTDKRETPDFTLRSSPGDLAIDGSKNDIILTINYNNGNANGSKTGKKWNQTPYTFSGWDQKSSATTLPTSLTGGTVDYVAGYQRSTVNDYYYFAVYTAGTATTQYSNNVIDLGTPTKSGTSTTYTVTYDGNGGTVSIASDTAIKTTTYPFDKWTGSNTNISVSGTSCTFKATGTVTASYKTSNSTTTVTLPTPTRTGYKFLGWAISSTATTGTYEGGTSYTPEANITLYAIWEINGLVRVYTGSEWRMAIPFVYNGSAWKQSIPYTYNGSAWKQGG